MTLPEASSITITAAALTGGSVLLRQSTGAGAQAAGWSGAIFEDGVEVAVGTGVGTLVGVASMEASGTARPAPISA